ncbi:MAG: hypothetical protein H7A43_03580, partial [Verrucomicrobia bacterium]|nr:hypothetical protein [Verrucomicrobiota bacterium]
LGEAPSFGKPIIAYNAYSTGAAAYRQLAREFLVRRREESKTELHVTLGTRNDVEAGLSFVPGSKSAAGSEAAS